MIFLAVFTLLAVISQTISQTCDSCGYRSGAACISETEFQICLNGYNGRPNENFTYSCPKDKYCTVNSAICEDKPASAACPYACGKCSNDKRFACLSETTFTFCFGTTDPHPDFVRHCPKGTVCGKHFNICMTPSQTVKPACINGQTAIIGNGTVAVTTPPIESGPSLCWIDKDKIWRCRSN